MYARVTEFVGATPEELAQDVRYFEDEILPRTEEIPGMSGGLVLLDRGTGRALAITLWSDETTLESSRDETSTLRELAFQRMNLSQRPTVREYDVAVARLSQPVTPVGR